ncbi:MAG: Holliday junction resolvase RuvX [Lachnospiraceae bacterium]|nr:Holliday junction resolvase RuvX [Lachnospiraceae bacterium]
MTGKIMGLDYGTKTVGVAVSDPLLQVAHPKETIFRDSEKRLRKTLARIEALIQEEQIEAIVVGLPLMPDGTEGERAKKAREFADRLKARTDLSVYLQDERYTTTASDEELEIMQVKREDRKKVIDQLAACHILDEFLNRSREEESKKEN